MRFIAATLSFLFVMLVLGGAGMLWVFWTFGRGLPDYEQLANYDPPVVTRVHAGNGALLAEYAREKRLFMPVEAIPPQLIAAFCQPRIKAFTSISGLICGLWRGRL